MQGTIVVDASGSEWLAGWAERRAALAAPHVRTPVMQHPHAQPLALKSFAEKQGRLQVSKRMSWPTLVRPSGALSTAVQLISYKRYSCTASILSFVE